MRNQALILLFIFLLSFSQAQRYDNTWLWGIYPQYQDSSSQYPFYGNEEGNFNNDTFTPNAKFRGMTFSELNCSISDPVSGNLLFYSNGLCVRDTNNQIIENGDSLSYGTFWHEENGSFGARGPWCMIGLPVPDKDSLYKLIYQRTDAMGGLASMCYSDVSVNSNKIKLLIKDFKFSPINKPAYGGLAACRHGNGKDWWVIFCEANTNCFHKYLLTSDTFAFHSIQCYGRPIDIADVTKNAFSPDGSKLIRTAYYGACDIFDFDRCSGLLSNFFPLDTFNVVDTASGNFWDGIFSAIFSNSNRFLYLNSGYFVLQYDLSSTDINSSRDTVGMIDYFIDTVPQNSGYYTFYLSQTAPDGKIYIGPGFGQRYFTTIENPEGKGDSCDFKLRGIQVSKWIDQTIPYFPNYRLGRLANSPCDTLYNSINTVNYEAPWLRIYPNPASDILRVEYNWIEWDKYNNCELKVFDMLGKIVFQSTIPRYSSVQELSVSHLSSGSYTVGLFSQNQQLTTAKVIIQKTE